MRKGAASVRASHAVAKVPLDTSLAAGIKERSWRNSSPSLAFSHSPPSSCFPLPHPPKNFLRPLGRGGKKRKREKKRENKEPGVTTARGTVGRGGRGASLSRSIAQHHAWLKAWEALPWTRRKMPPAAAAAAAGKSPATRNSCCECTSP